MENKSDRKSQIFAKTVKVGNTRRPVKPVQRTTSLKTIVDGFKKEINSTTLKSVSFKCKENIHTINNPKIQSISKGKKHVCFLVTGDETISKAQDLIKNINENENSHEHKDGCCNSNKNKEVEEIE